MENSFLRDAIDRITELARPSVMKVDDITYAHPGCMRPGRAILLPNYARHGVKLYSQCGCDPREQSAGGKDQR